MWQPHIHHVDGYQAWSSWLPASTTVALPHLNYPSPHYVGVGEQQQGDKIGQELEDTGRRLGAQSTLCHSENRDQLIKEASMGSGDMLNLRSKSQTVDEGFTAKTSSNIGTESHEPSPVLCEESTTIQTAGASGFMTSSVTSLMTSSVTSLMTSSVTSLMTPSVRSLMTSSVTALGDQTVNNNTESVPSMSNITCQTNHHNKMKRKQSPKRKRGERHEEKWKRNLAKKLRNCGQEYEGLDGKKRRARCVHEGCLDSCRYKCKDKVTEEERNRIFLEYWSLGETTRQRDFLIRCVSEVEKVRCKNDQSRRTRSLHWTLQVNNQRHTVCKTFFLHTLDITDQVVFTALKKKVAGGICAGEMRGKHNNRPNKITEEQKCVIRSHIESFPTVDTHYRLKGKKIRFIQPGLTLIKMYKSYMKHCTEAGIKLCKFSTYRRVVDDCNIAVHGGGKCNEFCLSCTRTTNNEKTSFTNTEKRSMSASKEKDVERSEQERPSSHFLAAYGLEQIVASHPVLY